MLYADLLSEQKMCLCAMLAAEYPTLPRPMQAAVAAASLFASLTAGADGPLVRRKR